MLWPDYKQFAALAKDATLVPVAKTVAADLRTPVSAFLSIAADEKRAPKAVLLESVEGGEKVGRYTFLGVRPYMVLRARGNQITLEKGNKRQQIQGNPFKVLDGLLREHKPA
ncbi:MAG TPA: anthranilate synthase component I, partial [Candidatus Angelobacter sp.]|nr:anthranilate synthase component I [Candidatus Angelobacter sp.]